MSTPTARGRALGLERVAAVKRFYEAKQAVIAQVQALEALAEENDLDYLCQPGIEMVGILDPNGSVLGSLLVEAEWFASSIGEGTSEDEQDEALLAMIEVIGGMEIDATMREEIEEWRAQVGTFRVHTNALMENGRVRTRGDCEQSPGSTCTHDPRGPEHQSGSVSWNEHMEAWHVYERTGGKLSAERIAQAGGFGYLELTRLLVGAPKTWEPLQNA